MRVGELERRMGLVEVRAEPVAVLAEQVHQLRETTAALKDAVSTLSDGLQGQRDLSQQRAGGHNSLKNLWSFGGVIFLAIVSVVLQILNALGVV